MAESKISQISDNYFTDSNEHFTGKYLDGRKVYRKYFTTSGTDSDADINKGHSVTCTLPSGVIYSTISVNPRTYQRRYNQYVDFQIREKEWFNTNSCTYTCLQTVTSAVNYELHVWIDYCKNE